MSKKSEVKISVEERQSNSYLSARRQLSELRTLLDEIIKDLEWGDIDPYEAYQKLDELKEKYNSVEEAEKLIEEYEKKIDKILEEEEKEYWEELELEEEGE